MRNDDYSDVLERLARIEAALESLVRASKRLPAQEWYSIEEVARLTGLSTDHVRRHVTSGLLPASNLGTFEKPYYRIRKTDVEEWMAKRREAPAPAPRKKPAPGSYISRHHKS